MPAIELEEGFGNYGDPFAEAAYTDLGGSIFLEGLVTHASFGNADAPLVIGTLPEGARPDATLPFDVFAGEIERSQYTVARLDVGTDGLLTFQGVIEPDQTVALLSLSSISFPAAGTTRVPDTPGDGDGGDGGAWIPVLEEGQRYTFRLSNGHVFTANFTQPLEEVTIIGRPSILVVQIGERTSWINLNEIAMVSEEGDS